MVKSNPARQRRVVVFGIFDGVHDGHRDLFRQALRLASLAQGKPAELVVIVGRDAIAEKLKHKRPKYSETERVEMLKKEPLVDDAILGDKELSTYTVLERCNPDIVCLGYDQNELEVDLRKWMKKSGKEILFVRLRPYEKEKFHSSLLR
ncbi:MAG TPA: adenylyltransferase/cytidyltransferase family protein [Candidatus Paceibacterota bacterium]